MTRTVFIKNAAILTTSGLLLRAVGMLFRIYLSNTIGAEGMGLYQLILSVYMLAAAFAGPGISTAVARLCSCAIPGSRAQLRQILYRAMALMAVAGGVLTAAGYLAAPIIARDFIADERASDAIRMLSLSLVPMGLSSCCKGYMLARRKTAAPAVAQLFEQAVRIGVAVLLIGSIGQSVERHCAAVLLADMIAECCSLAFIYLQTQRDLRRLSKVGGTAAHGLTRQLVGIAAPIVAGRYLSSGLHTAESLITPACLVKSGCTQAAAFSALGMLKGMALPLELFLSSLLISVSSLLIPELSEAQSRNDERCIRRQIGRVLALTLALSLPAAGFFAVCAQPLGVLIYSSSEVGSYIRLLAPLVPAMYIDAVCDGMLKGLGQQNRTLIYGLVDSVVRISLVLLLVPRYGMGGFIAMMTVSNLLTALLNVARLIRITGLRFRLARWLVRPLLLTAVAMAVAALFRGVSPLLFVLCSAAVFALAAVPALEYR